MARRNGSWILAGASLGLSLSLGAQCAMAQSSVAAEYRTVLNRYCVTCHNQKAKTAGLLLDKADVTNVAAEAALWEKVRRKLHDGAMPPAGMPRPDTATSKKLISWLEAELDRSAAAHPNPGRPAPHRLNRAEYTNAVRDLLAVDIDSRQLLPTDELGYGFDNIADVLRISPALLDRYLLAAQKISRLAVATSAIAPSYETFPVSPYLEQKDRMNEDLPFGSRGGTAVHYRFPVDGEYAVRVRLQRTFADEVRGVLEPHHIDVFLDGERIKVFTLGGPQFGRGGSESKVTADGGLEVRFPAKAGTHTVAVTFPKVDGYPEDVKRPDVALTSFAHLVPTGGDPDLSSIQIGGPFNPQGPGDSSSRRAIFRCHPDEKTTEVSCAREIIARLARRAYRQPVKDRQLQMLLAFYETGRRERGFEYGIEMAIQRMLVSPEFLFRIERDPPASAPGMIYHLTDLELASRLSFFLWSSIPDDELLDLAEHDKLRDPVVLERQVRRMIADPRSDTLVTNFAGQWLWLRNLRGVAPNANDFPYWDDSLREAFQKETELLVRSMVREDRPIPELLDAKYTFLNERLAKHYGIPGVYGSHFRRVTVADERRRGLLGQGSILTVTSYDDRTSPTKRGAWLLENILNAPSPPPPPNVPALKDNGENGQFLSMRERMEQHRKNPVCASCHARMDPLGFAMETFDAIGQSRTSEFGKPIDTSGTLPDGAKFQGSVELRAWLISHREDFAEAVTEKLLIYALGRGVEYYDLPIIRKITRETARNDYRWSSVILGIVKSPEFQMRRVPPAPPATSVAAANPAKETQ
jgi:mono/diheme cytochrome c family protein